MQEKMQEGIKNIKSINPQAVEHKRQLLQRFISDSEQNSQRQVEAEKNLRKKIEYDANRQGQTTIRPPASAPRKKAKPVSPPKAETPSPKTPTLHEGVPVTASETNAILSDAGDNKASVDARLAGGPRETPLDIVQLAQHIDANIKDLKGSSVKFTIAQRVALSASRGADTATRALNNLVAVGRVIKDSFTETPAYTDFKGALGKLLLSKAKTDQSTRVFAKSVKKVKHSTRRAITNYIQANGNIALLKERAAKTERPYLRKGYEDATKLTESERRLADNVRNYFDSKLEILQEAGLLEKGFENYANQLWETDPKLAENLKANLFKKTPDLLKKKFYDSYFKGEQAGKIPKNKDIGFLITVYDTAVNKALYTRKFIKDLEAGKTKGGEPIAIAESKLKDSNYNDYGMVNDSAFRKSKWIRKNKDGKNVFERDYIFVHKDHLTHVRNMVGHSKINEYKIGRVANKLSGEAKAIILSFSPFHQFHITTHAWMHKTKTWRLPEIDFDDPLTADLVKHGLQLGGGHTELYTFLEGLSGSPLVHKIPFLGKYMKIYAEWLFLDYIPKIKLEMAKHAYKRNVERNAKHKSGLDNDQVLEKTSHQSNAAFGEQNYLWLGSNKTIQNALRLSLLAPDFLVSRGKFAFHAFTKHGTEQRAAFIRGAIFMFIAARVLNYTFGDRGKDGKPNLYWDRPFSVVYNGREYTIKSVPGDLLHLLKDPVGFARYRANPITTKPLIEALTGQNKYGNPRTTGEQFYDLIHGNFPIFVQDMLKKDGDLISTILHNIGIPSWTYRTDAENMARKFWFDRGITPSNKNDAKSALVRQLIDMGRRGMPYEPLMRKSLAEGKIKHRDVLRIEREAKLTPFQSIAKRLSIDEVEQVIKVADKFEKPWLEKLLSDKIKRRDYVPKRKSSSFHSIRPNLRGQAFGLGR